VRARGHHDHDHGQRDDVLHARSLAQKARHISQAVTLAIMSKGFERYRGRTWFTTPQGGSRLGIPPSEVPVRFLDRRPIQEFLLDRYPDEVSECLGCAEDGAWTDDDLIPIAAIGGVDTDPESDDDEFLDRSYGWLFHDRGRDVIVLAQTDDWRRDNVVDGGLAALSLVPA
jgi:hypothetical protein